MVIYDSEKIFVDSATDICDKIAKIDLIITALEDAALSGAANEIFEEYNLDDGQTKIRTRYRSSESILNSIKVWTWYRERCINKLNGRQVRLVDSKSFKTRHFHGNF